MSELNGFEYQRWYDYGVLPEREWSEREVELKAEFTQGKLTVEAMEEELDIMMGHGLYD